MVNSLCRNQLKPGVKWGSQRTDLITWSEQAVWLFQRKWLRRQILDLRCVIPLSTAAAKWGTHVMSQYINPHSSQQLSDRLPCVNTGWLCPPAHLLWVFPSILRLLNKGRFIVMSAVLLRLWPQWREILKTSCYRWSIWSSQGNFSLRWNNTST